MVRAVLVTRMTPSAERPSAWLVEWNRDDGKRVGAQLQGVGASMFAMTLANNIQKGTAT